MPRLTKHSPILAIAIFASLISGCGGSGGSAPSKAEFIKQADDICVRMDATVLRGIKNLAKKYPALTKNVPEDAALEKAVSVVALPEIQKEAEEISALRAPKGDEQRIKAYAAEIEAGVNAAKKSPSKFTNDYGPFKRINEVGTAYGFKSCNEPL